MYRIPILVVLLGAPGLFGCQLLLELNPRQCERDADCAELLGAAYLCSPDTSLCELDRSLVDSGPPPLPEQWAPCLRENLPTAETFELPDDTSQTLRIALAAIDYTTHRTPPVTATRVCTASDFDCTDPYLEGVMVDDEGFLNFEAPMGFQGWIEVEAERRLPVRVYRNSPYDMDFRGFGVSMVSVSDVESLGTRSEDELDIEGSGLVVFQVLDCAGGPARGVTVARQGESPDLPFYFDGPLPDQDLSSTRVSTDLTHDGSPIAAGGFFNAKPGFASYEARLEETGDLVATVGVEVKAGQMTLIRIDPGDF